MIEIDFHPGLHGNFLCYSINALDPQVRESNPFTKFGTSHEFYPKILAARPTHYSMYGEPFKGRDVISIYADPEDCLLVDLLQYSRAADYDIDLKNLEKNFYQQVKTTNFGASLRESLLKTFEIDIKHQDVTRSQLREFFKYQFTNYETNSAIRMIRKQQYAFPVMWVDFKRFYDFDEYIRVLQRTIDFFNLEYQIDDIDWYRKLWTNFISKIDAIQCNQEAITVLNAIQQKQHLPIDFNILQEAWLNARLEVVYNKAMPTEQDTYFTNTKDIIEYLEL